MPLDFVCNLTLQDCASLNPGLIPAFLDKSCAQDIRLEGNIGRCGWSGAPCVVNGSSSNCAAGYAEVCRGGFCAGAPRDPCTSALECNYGVYCNVSSGTGGVCGGAGAGVYNEAGIDFGRDYCASGSAVLNSSGSWSCAPGPSLVLSSPIPAPPSNSIPNANESHPSATPSPSAPSTNGSPTSTIPSPSASSVNGSRPSTWVGAIIGGTISGLVIFALVTALLWRRRQQQSKKTIFNDFPHPASTSNDGPTNVHPPSPSPAAYATHADEMRASTSHAGTQHILQLNFRLPWSTRI